MISESKTFLQKYLNGPKDKAFYEPCGDGFLRILYDNEGEIMEAAFVRKHGAKPKPTQLQLYFMLNNDMVTFKSETSLSGISWSSGYADWGTVFDDDSYDGSSARKIGLDEWIDECLAKMCK